jgi:hypothetical protein
MPDGNRRIRLVCEDRLTERFLSKICQRQQITVLRVDTAPYGRGDASAWVRRKYLESVKLHRSKNYQKNLCLLVAIDGDNKGVSARQLELAQELANAGVEARKPDELIAVFVPTWSIETWLASLVEGDASDESRPLKEDNAVRHLWQDHDSTAHTVAVATNNWRAGPPVPRSLADAYTEGLRIGV